VRTERIASRVGWSDVAAVRDGHIYEIESAYILQRGSAALTEGLRQLHEILRKVVYSVPHEHCQSSHLHGAPGRP
jgi:iron complex transport system substrate-binding protein